jgi:signal recognition particle subunit SRP68
VLQTGKRDPKVLETKLRKARGKVYPGLVRIYDGVIRSLEQMRDLDIVENDGDLAALVEARIAFISACRFVLLPLYFFSHWTDTRSLRCKYLARTYALLSSYPSSLTLLNRAKLYTRQSRASLPLSPESYPLEVDYIEGSLPLDEAALDAFDLALEGDYTEVSQEWTRETGGVGVEDVSMEGLSLEGEKGGKKTKFYDVAFSYVGAFDLEAISRRAAGEVDQAVDEEEEQDEGEEEQEEVQEVVAKGKRWGFGLFGK